MAFSLQNLLAYFDEGMQFIRMLWKQNRVLRGSVLVITAVAFVLFIVYLTRDADECPTDGQENPIHTRMLKARLRERKQLSWQLNEQARRCQQQQCDVLESTGVDVVQSGGWCGRAMVDVVNGYSLDRHLADAAAELFSGKTVASFGEGPGYYRQRILDTRKVVAYDGYDGAPYIEKKIRGEVQFMDLTLPQYWLPVYDWVLCLEVAEHIPRQHETTFLDNLLRHARIGVVLSWATPGQGGHGHVNERSDWFVRSVMRRRGFNLDREETSRLRNAASFPHLRQNVRVFLRGDKMRAASM